MDKTAVLAEAADYFYETCELYEDEDLDPADHVAVIKRAFSSSDCDDFARVLHQLTDWPFIVANWAIPGYGPAHHSMVRAPDGQLLDVNGWASETDVQKRYCGRKKLAFTFTEAKPYMLNDLLEEGEGGTAPALARIVGVIRALPYPPFDTESFQAISGRAVEGADMGSVWPGRISL